MTDDDDRPRLPPGQKLTTKWPVLHVGPVPPFDPASWRLEVTGLVLRPLSLSWAELAECPRAAATADFHCVTRWTRQDNRWEGVSAGELVRRAGPRPEATHVLVHAAGGYTTNLPLADLLAGDVLLVDRHDGQALAPEHGGPLRLVVPHLYGWKSAKWVRRLELLAGDRPGYWEARGYAMYGDPWSEDRHA